MTGSVELACRSCIPHCRAGPPRALPPRRLPTSSDCDKVSRMRRERCLRSFHFCTAGWASCRPRPLDRECRRQASLRRSAQPGPGAARADDGRCRSGAVQGPAVPAGRAVARRARDDGDRRAVAAAHLLHGRRQRRRVPDDRRRRELGADHRRQGPARLDRDRSRSRTPIRTSSISAPAPTACAATSPPAAASTRRPTPARRGASPGSTTPDRSAPSASIRPIPNIVWVAADGRHLQAERRARHLQDDRRRQDAGRRCCSSPTASARWTSSCSPATRTSSTRGCRGSSASRGRSSAAREKAASTRAPTAASTSRRSRRACRASLIGKGNLAVTAANPNRIYALIEAKPGGGLYRSDEPAQTWTR